MEPTGFILSISICYNSIFSNSQETPIPVQCESQNGTHPDDVTWNDDITRVMSPSMGFHGHLRPFPVESLLAVAIITTRRVLLFTLIFLHWIQMNLVCLLQVRLLLITVHWMLALMLVPLLLSSMATNPNEDVQIFWIRIFVLSHLCDSILHEAR